MFFTILHSDDYNHSISILKRKCTPPPSLIPASWVQHELADNHAGVDAANSKQRIFGSQPMFMTHEPAIGICPSENEFLDAICTSYRLILKLCAIQQVFTSTSNFCGVNGG